jgi:hypothetical protein
LPQRQNKVDNNMSGDISIALGSGASTIGIIGCQREKDYFAHGRSSTKSRTVTTNYRKGNIF